MQVCFAWRKPKVFYQRDLASPKRYAKASAEVAEVKLLFILIFKPKIISYFSARLQRYAQHCGQVLCASLAGSCFVAKGLRHFAE